jgi:hypothetical protein
LLLGELHIEERFLIEWRKENRIRSRGMSCWKVMRMLMFFVLIGLMLLF